MEYRNIDESRVYTALELADSYWWIGSYEIATLKGWGRYQGAKTSNSGTVKLLKRQNISGKIKITYRYVNPNFKLCLIRIRDGPDHFKIQKGKAK